MCDRWPFPACQRRGGEKISHILKNTLPEHPDHSAVRFTVMVGWLLSEGGVWTDVTKKNRQHTHTHTLSPLNIDAKSEIYTNKVIINTDARQNSTYYFFSMDTVCIEYVDDLKAVTQTHTCMHPSSYVHRNTHAELRSSACQISDTLREKKAS